MVDENRGSVEEQMNQEAVSDPEDTAGQKAQEETDPSEEQTVENKEEKKTEETTGETPSEEPDPLAESQAKVAELTDRVQRQMAEFENFRRRSEKEKAAMFEMGARSVIEKILPVIDNFERGLAVVTPEQKEDPFEQGMEKIYRQLLQEMENIGVKAIEAKGQNFDPSLHNAVMHIDDDTIDENIVVEEFQKGYTYRGAVIRASMVKVAN